MLIYMVLQMCLCVLQDLLRPENENLQIRESDTGVFVAGVHETEVKGMEDCLHLLQLGERNRYSNQRGQQREKGKGKSNRDWQKEHVHH